MYSEQEMKKLEALKVGGDRREGRKKTTQFVGWKAYFSSCYIFSTLFHLHFKDDF